MAHLFIKGFEIISNDNSNSFKNEKSENNLDAILNDLLILLNSIDKNENSVFTKLKVETNSFRLYNRIIGYRNTARGITMLHTMFDFLLKKMIAMKSKNSILNVSQPASKTIN